MGLEGAAEPSAPACFLFPGVRGTLPACRASPQALFSITHWPFRVGQRQRFPAPECPCLLNSHALKISVQSFFLPSLQSPPYRIRLAAPHPSPGERNKIPVSLLFLGSEWNK